MQQPFCFIINITIPVMTVVTCAYIMWSKDLLPYRKFCADFWLGNSRIRSNRKRTKHSNTFYENQSAVLQVETHRWHRDLKETGLKIT